MNKPKMTIALAVITVLASVTVYTRPASAAACVAPGTDYGTVTMTASLSAAGTYRVWTRMAAPNSTDNSYMLEIDGNNCYTVGGSSVPTYASGSTTRFESGTTNWKYRTTANAAVDVALSAGSHTLKLIGTSEGVVVDRVIITADTTCVPVGTGDNCATIYLAVDINQDTHVDVLDLGQLAGKYNQTSNLGRTDVNSDGVVNLSDLSALASKYEG